MCAMPMITIPFPRPMKKRRYERGAAAKYIIRSMRFSALDWDIIETAAKVAGMPTQYFCRHACFFTAQALLQEFDNAHAQSTDIESNHPTDPGRRKDVG